MRRLDIRDADIMRLAIRDEIQRSEESRYNQRLHGVLLACSGMSSYDIAALLGQSPRSVQYWIHRFQDHGFAGLQEGERRGRPSALSGSALQAVGQDLRGEPRLLGYPQTLWDGKLLSHHLKTRYQIHMGVRQCQRLFHQVGFRWRKPRSLIAQADPEAKAAYKKLRRLARREDVDLWFSDECHFQQHGSRCVMWIPPENTGPVLYHAPTRKSVAVFGAVCPADGRPVTLPAKTFNA